eukprot:TRINITY_DN29851_c0_g1_i1.p1 TRINITY_DN29851_c0_g1~~TRINITY_DN29851_c0_g1_i1.p1  ORF type:complete len:595 (-),score=117.72 TRINITY_DN29851_c0_g1_i1:161-1945(-)
MSRRRHSHAGNDGCLRALADACACRSAFRSGLLFSCMLACSAIWLSWKHSALRGEATVRVGKGKDSAVAEIVHATTAPGLGITVFDGSLARDRAAADLADLQGEVVGEPPQSAAVPDPTEAPPEPERTSQGEKSSRRRRRRNPEDRQPSQQEASSKTPKVEYKWESKRAKLAMRAYYTALTRRQEFHDQVLLQSSDAAAESYLAAVEDAAKVELQRPKPPRQRFLILSAWRKNKKATLNWAHNQNNIRNLKEFQANFQCYAGRHDYDLKIYTEADDPKPTLGLSEYEFASGYWVKPYALLHHLKQRKHSWIFWLDSDARFMELNVPLQEITRGVGDDVHLILPREYHKECRFSAFAVLIRVSEIGQFFVERWFANYRNSCGYNDQCPLWHTILEFIKNQTVVEWADWLKKAQTHPGPDLAFNRGMAERSARCDGSALTMGPVHFTPYNPKVGVTGLAYQCGMYHERFEGNGVGMGRCAFVMHKPHDRRWCKEAWDAVKSKQQLMWSKDPNCRIGAAGDMTLASTYLPREKQCNRPSDYQKPMDPYDEREALAVKAYQLLAKNSAERQARYNKVKTAHPKQAADVFKKLKAEVEG